MRQIILDTETTGLDPRQGHRVIEIAGVELVNRRLTGQHFHRYLNPDRDIDEGAMQVHGITREFLEDKPRFGDVVDDFLAFIQGAELIIHNASFDVSFLDSELEIISRGRLDQFCMGVVDTLAIARGLHPGQRNNLDALCKRYEVDNSNRTLHGALLDCELLAQVYLGMTRGQNSLLIDQDSGQSGTKADSPARKRSPVLRIFLTDEEEAAHQISLQEIDRESGGMCMWNLQRPVEVS
ncbi:MAG: DNA polymerase III subunit epsilon [Hydrogenophilaceae bacterium]|nr:DNA polymerase III subunit epsilon [Hydrogenophilaceae bacterium]